MTVTKSLFPAVYARTATAPGPITVIIVSNAWIPYQTYREWVPCNSIGDGAKKIIDENFVPLARAATLAGA